MKHGPLLLPLDKTLLPDRAGGRLKVCNFKEQRGLVQRGI
jgi:hypothetical protein